MAALATTAQGQPVGQQTIPDLEVGDRVPVARTCDHPSGDQRVALALPGTAWLQRDHGPRAVYYQLAMDVEEVSAILASLQDDFVSLAEVGEDATGSSVSPGIVAERCELRIFDHGTVITIQYSGLDTLSPALATVDRTLDEIAVRALENPAPTWSVETLRVGDVLRRRADGVLFEYYGETGDGLGVELHGVTQPLVVLETRAELPRRYDRLATGDHGEG